MTWELQSRKSLARPQVLSHCCNTSFTCAEWQQLAHGSGSDSRISPALHLQFISYTSLLRGCGPSLWVPLPTCIWHSSGPDWGQSQCDLTWWILKVRHRTKIRTEWIPESHPSLLPPQCPESLPRFSSAIFSHPQAALPDASLSRANLAFLEVFYSK